MKTILVDALGTFVTKGEGINADLFNLLESYQNQKIIVSNANDAQIVEFGLANLPYPLFTLKHDPDKDNPEYFVKLLAHYGLTAEEVVYFEHAPEAVKSAQSLGITSHWYDANVKDVEGVKKFLDAALREVQ